MALKLLRLKKFYFHIAYRAFIFGFLQYHVQNKIPGESPETPGVLFSFLENVLDTLVKKVFNHLDEGTTRKSPTPSCGGKTRPLMKRLWEWLCV